MAKELQSMQTSMTSFSRSGSFGKNSNIADSLASMSSVELSSMVAAWVDSRKKSEYEKEISSTSGTNFQTVAMKQRPPPDAVESWRIPRLPSQESEEGLSSQTTNGHNSPTEACYAEFRRCLSSESEDGMKQDSGKRGSNALHDSLNKVARTSSLCYHGTGWPIFSRCASEWEKVKNNLFTFSFNALDYSEDDLTVILGELCLQLNIDKVLRVSWATIQSFILSARAGMPHNPYHNWTHVVDVTQTAMSMAKASGVLELLCPKQRLALFLAALCHDIEHPGVTAGFLLKSNSNMAAWYKHDPGLLEKHHSIRAFELLVCKGCGLLRHLPPDERSSMRRWVRDVILATDMARHATIVQEVERRVVGVQPEPPGPLACEGGGGGCGSTSIGHAGSTSSSCSGGTADGADGGEMMLHMQLLLKCADISNVVKPLPVAMEWAVAVTDEFFAQGDRERFLGLEVTPMCDRHGQTRVGIQRGFIDYLAGPLFRAAARFLPGLAPLVVQLEANRRAVDALTDPEMLAQVSQTREVRAAATAASAAAAVVAASPRSSPLAALRVTRMSSSPISQGYPFSPPASPSCLIPAAAALRLTTSAGDSSPELIPAARGPSTWAPPLLQSPPADGFPRLVPPYFAAEYEDMRNEDAAAFGSVLPSAFAAAMATVAAAAAATAAAQTALN